LIDQSDRPNRAIVAQVVSVLSEVGLPDVVLVGAAARDIWLDELGRPSERATNDVDFGFGVRDWASYKAIRSSLLNNHGFKATHVEHRLTFQGHIVDLVPFGAIEGKDRTIVWPEGGTRMNVLGFDEAATHAETVKLPGDLLVRIATLPALLVLKLMAWHDRKLNKDAIDFWSLLMAAVASDDMQERLYEDPVYEAYGFDRDLAGSAVLGRDARKVLEAKSEAIAVLARILATEGDRQGSLGFVSKGGNTDRKLDMLRAFESGLNYAK
jgi:predicted nucleotidyltransferase